LESSSGIASRPLSDGARSRRRTPIIFMPTNSCDCRRSDSPAKFCSPRNCVAFHVDELQRSSRSSAFSRPYFADAAGARNAAKKARTRAHSVHDQRFESFRQEYGAIAALSSRRAEVVNQSATGSNTGVGNTFFTTCSPAFIVDVHRSRRRDRRARLGSRTKSASHTFYAFTEAIRLRSDVAAGNSVSAQRNLIRDRVLQYSIPWSRRESRRRDSTQRRPGDFRQSRSGRHCDDRPTTSV